MGGKGTYSLGKSPDYIYETVGKIDGVKVLEPIDKTKTFKLPEESHTAGNHYVLLNKGGIFRQYREYDNDHQLVFEIGYHPEPKLGKGNVLHVHIHKTPGIEHHSSAEQYKIDPGHPIYEKYKNLFVGVTS